MSSEIPGNAVGSQAAFERQLLGAAAKAIRLEGALHRMFEAGVTVRSIVFRAPKTPGQEWLVIVRADKDGAAAVAFLSEETFWDAVRRLVSVAENGSFKWKDDEYA